MTDALIGFYGDLHLGNFYSDVDGFLDMNKESMGLADKYILVLVGDVIEGSNKYRTQIYKMFNIEPLRVQLDYLTWVLDRLFDQAEENGVDLTVHIVLGNHDLGYDYGNLIKYVKRDKVFVSYDTLILKTPEHKIVCKHQLNRGSRGSYLTWWSGYLLNLGEKLLNELGGDILVTAHTHRPDIAIVNRDNRYFIGLSAFIVSNEDYKYNKAVLYRDGWFNIMIRRKNNRMDVQKTNITRMAEIIGQENLVEEYIVQ